MKAHKKAYETDFSEINHNWLYSYPWGTPDNERGMISETCLEIVDDGLLFTPILRDNGSYLLPRIFWKGAPFSFGLFEAEMTVPYQSAVPDFVLYSKAQYKRNIRSILPEIDIVEFGTENHPNKMNMAVHRWKKNFNFAEYPKYYTDKRHELDYVGHKQTNKTIGWINSSWPDGVRRLYQCEVTRRSVKIYVDGIKQFHRRIKLDASFTPSFGISVPGWITNPDPSWMIVHNFSVQQ